MYIYMQVLDLVPLKYQHIFSVFILICLIYAFNKILIEVLQAVI